MKRCEHLPSYHKTFDLALSIETEITGFPCKHTHVLDARLQGLSLDMLSLFIRARHEPGKRRVAALDEPCTRLVLLPRRWVSTSDHATVQSYLARTTRADTLRLERKIFEQNRWVGRNLCFVGRVAASRSRAGRSFYSIAGRAVLLFRVVKYNELYDRRERTHARKPRLRPIAIRSVFSERGGFHRSLLTTTIQRTTRDLGLTVLVVEESRALGRSPADPEARFWATLVGERPINPREEHR